jgi:flagellin-like protein
MKRSFRRNRKAVSPVIATIIIVAVAIVMSIAVAYWMLGLAGTFTRFEKLEFVSAYPVKYASNSTHDAFNITISVKNSGTSPATVTKFFFNGIPDTTVNSTNIGAGKKVDDTDHSGLRILYGSSAATATSLFEADKTTVTVNPGETKTFSIHMLYNATIGSGYAVSGVSLEITIQTAAGNQYPKSITLP